MVWSQKKKWFLGDYNAYIIGLLIKYDHVRIEKVADIPIAVIK